MKKKCKLQLLKLLEFDEGYLSALGSAFMIDQNICDWDNFENYKKKSLRKY